MDVFETCNTNPETTENEHSKIRSAIARITKRLSDLTEAIEALAMELYGESMGAVTNMVKETETPSRPGSVGAIHDECEHLSAQMERAKNAFSNLQR